MKIQKNFCDICRNHPTDTKCDICKRFICYGNNGCLKSWGFGFNNNIFCGLNLCPDCEKKIKRRVSTKSGSKKDKEFFSKIETQMKEYIVGVFKLNKKNIMLEEI